MRMASNTVGDEGVMMMMMMIIIIMIIRIIMVVMRMLLLLLPLPAANTTKQTCQDKLKQSCVTQSNLYVSKNLHLEPPPRLRFVAPRVAVSARGCVRWHCLCCELLSLQLEIASVSQHRDTNYCIHPVPNSRLSMIGARCVHSSGLCEMGPRGPSGCRTARASRGSGMS